VAKHRKIKLKLVLPPSGVPVVEAPPVLFASSHTIEYTCANCGTVLLHAEEGQVHHLIIKCTECKAHNSTDL
jgi:DNA-directed RNA polymerase subunit RPC12/RpoP